MIRKHKQKLVYLPLHVPLHASPYLLILHLASPVSPSVTATRHWPGALRGSETEHKNTLTTTTDSHLDHRAVP